jgi:Threonine dehydrogenase and related Zn-dependent dehydrogenases
MIQQVMTSPGTIEFREIPVPELKAGEVLVKIKRIGVCGSDIHVYHGKHPFTKYPVTQGHEVSGVIEKISDGVEGLKVGDKVTIEPQVVCGKCHPCRHGKYNLCESLKVMGFQTTGTASEYFAVDAHKVTLLPQTMTYNQGAMIEPLAVTVHAARRFNELKGSSVAILGCGPIGILLAQSVKALGAKAVLITDISDGRLALAKKCGVDYTANTAVKDFGEAVHEAFGPDGADVIYDCAGNDITMGQAIKYARKGSKIVLVAVYAGIAHVDLAVLNDHELDLDTTMMYRHEDYVTAIDLVNKGLVKLEPLMTKHFAFRDYKKAYEYIDANRESTMKVIIDVDPEGV